MDPRRELEGKIVISRALLQGVLLQIFTQPVSDRPTVIVEIIQRIGAMRELTGTAARAVTGSADKPVLAQPGACGGYISSFMAASSWSPLEDCFFMNTGFSLARM